MVDFLIKLAVNAAALFVATRVVPRLDLAFDGPNWWKAIVVALIFGVVNTYLRPIVKLLSLPLTIFAIGLVGFLVNLAMFLLVGFVSGQLGLGLKIAGWPPGKFDADVMITALIASIVMSIVATALSLLLVGRRMFRM